MYGQLSQGDQVRSFMYGQLGVLAEASLNKSLARCVNFCGWPLSRRRR